MKNIFLFFLAFFFCAQSKADNFQVITDGPLHEAFVVQEYGTLLSEIVPNQPPHKIHERASSHEDQLAIWIPGYWSWLRKDGIFLWVSGVWRRPPPDHQWISGYWKRIEDGWIWIRGFWSKTTEENLIYNTQPPPDPIDERIPALPSSIGDYFWIPGYWRYKEQVRRYVWYSGHWTVPEQQWVYVPPQYFWREKGYVMNPAYWDWPLDERGLVFNSIYVAQKDVDFVVYEPENPLQSLTVLQQLFPYWPNYLCLFRHSYFFHNDVWKTWGAAPLWWDWPSWWSYTSTDSWALWWWWTHPGYPNPTWIDASLADLLTPPPAFVENMMAPVQPPLNVTPNGVVGTKKILEALDLISGKKIPILPADPKQIGQIQEIAKPQAQNVANLLPRGKNKPATIPEKAFFGPSQESLPSQPEKGVLPEIPKNPPKQSTQISQCTLPTPVAQPTVRPMPTPESQRPYLYITPPPERPIRQPQGVRRRLYIEEHDEYFNDPRPAPLIPESDYERQTLHPQHFQNPAQGYPLPPTRYQQSPMQTEHHDLFMGHPQPQVNPRGPKAHQVPGDYSTLPRE